MQWFLKFIFGIKLYVFCSVHHQEFFPAHTAIHTGLLTACDQDQDGTAVPSWSWSQAVSKPVWHIPLLCVQWKTPDDGQSKTCRVLFQKNKFEKLVHLVDFIMRIYHDAPLLRPDPARMLSAHLYDIYHCCVYSGKLLMKDRGTVRNM